MWAGNYNFKSGGTSDIIAKANASSRSITIDHLLTPRKQNPYPINGANKNLLSPQNGNLQRNPFALNYTWVCWNNLAINANMSTESIPKSYNGKMIWMYLAPILLALMTTVLATIEFASTTQEPIMNSIF